jgi:hypothetical protein
VPGGPGSLRRVAGLVVAAVSLATLFAVTLRTERAIALAADVTLARSAAAYLSLVVPRDERGDYRPGPLLSTASALEAAPFWRGGLQVAYGRAGLLPDEIGLTPLDEATDQALDTSHQVEVRLAGQSPVAVVPLPAGEVERGGWVAVWDSAPGAPRGPATFRLAGGALLVVALAGALRRPSARWAAAGAAITCAVALALGLHAGVGATSRVAQETTLVRVRRLIQLGVAPGPAAIGRAERLAPGMTVHLAAGAAAVPRDSVLHRGDPDAPVALVRVPLPGGQMVEIAAAAQTDWRPGLGKELAAAVALFVVGATLAARRPPSGAAA